MTSPDPRGPWEIEICPKHGPTLGYDANTGFYCKHTPCSMMSEEVERITVTEVQSSDGEREALIAIADAAWRVRTVLNLNLLPLAVGESIPALMNALNDLNEHLPLAEDGAWWRALSEPPKERDG